MRSATSWESENGPIDDMVVYGFYQQRSHLREYQNHFEKLVARGSIYFGESIDIHIVLVKEQIGREMLARRWPEGIWVSAARSCYGYTRSDSEGLGAGCGGPVVLSGLCIRFYATTSHLISVHIIQRTREEASSIKVRQTSTCSHDRTCPASPSKHLTKTKPTKILH